MKDKWQKVLKILNTLGRDESEILDIKDSPSEVVLFFYDKKLVIRFNESDPSSFGWVKK